MIDNETKEVILKAAMLIEENNHISCSSAGLKQRTRNRNVALLTLKSIIGIDEEDFKEIYNKFQESRG